MFKSFLLLLAVAGSLCAAPTMEVAEVLYTHQGSTEKLGLSWDGTWLRIDQHSRRFAVLYRPKDDFFIGLEERDRYTWHFSWPALEAASKRQQNGKAILNQPVPGMPVAAPASLEKPPAPLLWQFKGGDGKQRLWEARGEGTAVFQARVDFQEKPDPHTADFVTLWKHYARAADLIHLTAVRDMAPDGMQPVVDALPADAGSPASLTWLEHGIETARLTMETPETVSLDKKRFAPPSDYRETELDTLEGILKEAPPAPKPITGGGDVETEDRLTPTP